MTLWDDVPCLLTKLRHAFITNDDTGLCEMVITEDTVTRDDWNMKDNCIVYTKNGTNKMSVSPDIYPEMDYGARRVRRRSQTDERLEKLKRDKLAQTTEHVQWKPTTDQLPESELEDMFSRKEVSRSKSLPKSALSLLLETSVPLLPFREYAKFDSEGNPGSHAKTIEILAVMTEGELRSVPIKVTVLSSATVKETIGVVCWHYTRQERKPELSENLDLFDLYMEDFGEPDMDFPPLDKREPISKFGFNKLALVQQQQARPAKKPQHFVTVHISTKGMTKVQVDDLSVTMREILDKVIKRRVGKETLAKGLNYNLEKYDEPGVAVDLNERLSSMNTDEFFMVRENSARGTSVTDAEVVDIDTMADSLTAFQYKLYKVYMQQKLLQKREIHIGISRDQVEIIQISKSRPGKSKTSIVETPQIAGCEILDQKSVNKTVIRFIYQNSTRKLEHYDFECDPHLGVEIVSKINNIVDFFSSPVRVDYLKTKGEKTSHRKSLYSES